MRQAPTYEPVSRERATLLRGLLELVATALEEHDPLWKRHRQMVRRFR